MKPGTHCKICKKEFIVAVLGADLYHIDCLMEITTHLRDEKHAKPSGIFRKMKTFWIRYGTINGLPDEWEEIEAKDEDQATLIAWEAACDDYESYAGLHGLRDTGQIEEEDGVDSDEAQDIFEEDRESWLDYEVREDDPDDD